MWPVTDDLLGVTLPQVEWAIKMLRDSGGNTNQATIEIGRPEDITVHDNAGVGYDPPCMRLIDCRVRYGKLHLVVYFRSWDAWGGFPVNMAGLRAAQAVDGRPDRRRLGQPDRRLEGAAPLRARRGDRQDPHAQAVAGRCTRFMSGSGTQ